MGKREFNSQKLYKLTKIIVIIITVIALLRFLLAFSNNSTYTQFCLGKDFQKFEEIGNPGLADRNRYQKDFTTCLNYALKQDNQFNEITNISLGIAVFLPLLFLGGRLIYKYIFPIQS